jgi:hypothetical protein
MLHETFTSERNTYKVTVYPGPTDGKKHPMIVFVHGNWDGVGNYSVTTYCRSRSEYPLAPSLDGRS